MLSNMFYAAFYIIQFVFIIMFTTHSAIFEFLERLILSSGFYHVPPVVLLLHFTVMTLTYLHTLKRLVTLY